MAPACIVAAAACFGIALSAAKVRYASTWQERVPNGVPVAAHFGDRIIVRPLVPGTITFAAYPLAIQSTAATHDRPAVFDSSGNDTYEVTSNHQGALDIATEAMRPAVSPWWIAFFLFLAATFAVLAAMQSGLTLTSGLKVRLDVRSLSVGAGALLLFALVPHYLHNDQFGGGIHWGYLGWGYVDTVQALPLALRQSGLLGLVTVESLTKPILLPVLTAPLAGLLGALNAAIVVSLICTGLATAAVYRLGELIFERWVGVLAAALFAFTPLVVAYATAFYLDIPYVMFSSWSAVFLIVAARERARAPLIIGVLLGVLAVGARNPVMAGLYFFTIVLLLLAARVATWRAISVAFLGSLAAFFGAVFLWPFLWIDAAHRLPFVLVARLLFDQYYHLTQSVASRIGIMTTQTFVHSDPLTILLLIVGVGAAIFRRDARILLLSAGIVVGRLFVAPTSFYLQHYWFYLTPFLQLVAGYSITLFGARFRASVAASVGALVFAWSAVYFPYASSATLGCLSFTCSAQRWGVGEPVYGLKEAALWIRRHVPRDAIVGTLIAPHSLQVQLPGYAVRFITLPTGRERQSAVLSAARVDYIVSNAWTLYRAHRPVIAPDAHRVWQSLPREGLVSIYKLERATDRSAPLDAPPPQVAQRLLPAQANRIVVYPTTVSYHAFFPRRSVAVVSERVHPLRSFASLLRLGGGVALLAGGSRFAAFDYERPIARSGNDLAEALPTLRGMQPVRSVRLAEQPAPIDRRGATMFAGQIAPHGDERFFSDVFEVDVETAHAFASPESLTMTATCARGSARLRPVWIGAKEVRGYAAGGNPLSECIRSVQPIVASVSFNGRRAPGTRAFASLLFNGDNALARAGSLPLAIFAARPVGSMQNVVDEDGVRAFLDRHDAAALVVPAYQTRFDLQAATQAPLTEHATLLTFFRPRAAPTASLAPARYGCVRCSGKPAAQTSLREIGTATWVWIADRRVQRAKELALDVSSLRIKKGGVSQAALYVIDPNGKGCARWDLGPLESGHVLSIVPQRLSDRGCRLTDGTQLALVFYTSRGTTLAAQPLLRIWL